ncbi:MAG: sigma 54-interacting transcriptional regulator [Desulfitobacteriaceae bacterium]
MLTVKEVMTNEFIALEAKESVAKAIDLLNDVSIPGLVIVECGQLIGVLEHKRAFQILLEGKDLDSPVGEIANRDVPIVFEYYLISHKLLDFTFIPVVNDEREVIGCVTPTKLFQGLAQSTINSEIQMNALLNFSHNGIVIVDKAGCIISFNNDASRIAGVSPQAALGLPINELIPYTGLLRVLESGKAEYGQEMKIGAFTVIADRHPIFQGEEPVGAIGIFQDVSETQVLIGELRQVKGYYQELDAIVNSFYDGVYISDGQGNGLRVNSAYERITGVRAHELLGKNMREVVEQGIVSDSVTLKVIEQKKPVTITQKIKTGVEVLVTGNPVFNEDGELVKIVTNVRDMSELNRLQKELTEVQQLSARYFSELTQLRRQQLERDKFVAISPSMSSVIDQAHKVAAVDSTVLVSGESGVGKEVVAKYIHEHSKRREGMFVTVNSGAIPENLLESELFGYESGAFTGAKREGKQGLFELADKGTLFLDEIGDLPLSLQVKLLRVLQDFAVTRVGGTKTVKVDARIIAATNRDLIEMVKNKLFREDLFYRLNIVPIHIPPLRERKDDIIPLSYYFLNLINNKYGFSKRFTPEVMRVLEEYDWPGNVRELQNIVERMAVMSYSDNMVPDHLPESLQMLERNLIIPKKVSLLKKVMEDTEKRILLQALREHKSMRRAAKNLGIDQSTMVRKVQKYDLKF